MYWEKIQVLISLFNRKIVDFSVFWLDNGEVFITDSEDSLVKRIPRLRKPQDRVAANSRVS